MSIYFTVITMVLIPYSAMVPELSGDYHERTSIMGVRLAFSFLSTLFCAVLPVEIIKAVRNSGYDEASGYLVMAVVFGIFFALKYGLTAEMHTRLQALLKSRRKGSPCSSDEEDVLKAELL